LYVFLVAAVDQMPIKADFGGIIVLFVSLDIERCEYTDALADFKPIMSSRVNP
jgi:hypothetical protein